MPHFRLKPSRPAALMSALIALVILLLVLSASSGFSTFLAIWTIVLLAVIGFNLWVAFAPRETGQSDRARRPRRRELSYRS